MAVCVGLWRVTPEPHHDGGVPLGFAVFGVVATGWNLHVLVLTNGLAPV